MQRGAGYFEILIIIIISLIVLLVFPLGEFLPIIAYSQIPYLPNQQQQSLPTEKRAIFNGGNINNNNNKNKVAIITFGDAWKSEYTTAKPILDKYGFKASYFIPCNYPDLKHTAMTWQDIAALHNDGMDIESKGMNDILVTDLSASALDFEIGQSKQCFY